MNNEKGILILAHKEADRGLLRRLLAERYTKPLSYDTVSKGVRELEGRKTDLVILVPGPDDDSWRRAIRRIREEYERETLLLAPDPGGMHKVALEAGAFAYFDPFSASPEGMACCLRHLARQRELQRQLEDDRRLFRWQEKSGRLGSWEIEKDGTTRWSEGLRRILGDDERLTDSFESMRTLVHPEDLEIFEQANKATFQQGWSLDFEYRVVLDNGEIRYLSLHRQVEFDSESGENRVLGMIRDVTPEREFENFLFRRDAILQIVASFASKVLRDPDWRSGLGEAMANLGKVSEVSRSFLFRRKESPASHNTVFSMIHEWTDGQVTPLLESPEFQDQPFSPTFDRWKTILGERKIVAGNVRDFQTGERIFFERLQTQSVILVPVFVGNTWWGFFGLTNSREEREWMPVEIESMTMLADILGAAILRDRMEDELKEANRSAEEARIAAQEANRTKSRFLANMSHEIRTPISGILGMAEMTITTGLTKEQREHMDMIREAARSLLSIVNDILDLSKVEAHKMELKPEDFDIRQLLETTTRHFAPAVEKKPIALNQAVAGDVPETLRGDKDRLGQILRNLIGNAVKFTERGHVDVSVEISERQEERVCLLFTVQDSGIGIPENKLATVFDSFTQVDSSSAKTHQGTGLGLTISREFVRMMGGDISVKSADGFGSVFSFTAWMDVPATTAPRCEPARAVLPAGLHLDILLAEDNPLNQKFLTHFLTMFGHRVTVAGNGLEAIRLLEETGRKTDLVLMDIQMPEMGGIDATRCIREGRAKGVDPSIPIIALTAYAMKGDKERMFEAGMDDYVSKPVEMKELSAAIARTVAAHTPNEPRSKPAMPSRPAARKETVSLDMDSLISRFEGNTELLKEILELFLEEADAKLDKLDNALRTEDMTELGEAVHSITNIASHVLAMEIVHRARALEKQCYSEPLEEIRPEVEALRPQFLALVREVREKSKTL
ncbi:hybrid sensor histidine kinase/response regulator [Pseudodesulfovibrio cashew]|uniref:hybrid sensor histidine kinase/response regulator n=1 Tax=Pseudodesulfovibrio cashew TaxID=2678688 RepID=UPI00131B3F9B|nr:ATP-binding protein [Pseudodesulfovibrio cashew]